MPETDQQLSDVIFETADALILTLDTQGRILRFNPKCEALTGYGEAEISGRYFWDVLVRDEDREFFKTRYSDSRGKLVTRTRENKWVSRDGRILTISFQNSVIPAKGPEGYQVLSIGIDVTEAREAAARLAESERLNALGRLTGGVAHDFNNLLAVIMGNAELLRDPRSPEEERADFADEIIRAAERGSALVMHLLSFGRRAHLQPRQIPGAELLDTTAAMVRRVIPSSIRVIIDDHSEGHSVYLDRDQLEVALLNLALNARDAMPEGGTLTLKSETVLITPEFIQNSEEEILPGRYLRLSVRDTGSGMDADMMRQVWDPFFTTKPVGQGSGLGLSMVLGFVRQSGGLARIASTPGTGTEVTLFLPTGHADDAPSEPGDEVPEDHARGGLDVLLAEDEAAVRQIIERHLGAAGHRVVSAPDGETALNRVKAGLRPDILVTDVVMPGGVQGNDLAKSVSDLVPDIGIVLLSGGPASGATIDCATATRKLFLNKPVSKDELLAAIARVAKPKSVLPED